MEGILTFLPRAHRNARYNPHQQKKRLRPAESIRRRRKDGLEGQEAKAPGHQTRDASVASRSKTITGEVDSWN